MYCCSRAAVHSGKVYTLVIIDQAMFNKPYVTQCVLDTVWFWLSLCCSTDKRLRLHSLFDIFVEHNSALNDDDNEDDKPVWPQGLWAPSLGARNVFTSTNAYMCLGQRFPNVSP
jgi:hypothetical protein